VDNLRVGTASWTTEPLIKSGRFTGWRRRPGGLLRYYASQFPVVRSIAASARCRHSTTAWANRTPESFTFDVKLFHAFTLHQTPLKALPTAIREEVTELANKAGNVYYEDLPIGVKDDLWRMFLEALAP
jgi:uncharacterized protein YecE (DUF72 family)